MSNLGAGDIVTGIFRALASIFVSAFVFRISSESDFVLDVGHISDLATLVDDLYARNNTCSTILGDLERGSPGSHAFLVESRLINLKDIFACVSRICNQLDGGRNGGGVVVESKFAVGEVNGFACCVESQRVVAGSGFLVVFTRTGRGRIGRGRIGQDKSTANVGLCVVTFFFEDEACA